MTCLAKNPNERWQNAYDVSLALKGIVEHDTDVPRPRRPAGARWRLHAMWAAALIALALVSWTWRSSTDAVLPPPNATPVVVLMDSPLAGRVYDARTEAAGGTNADDVTDALRDLAALTFKENTSPSWHREEQVRLQNPDLVIAHLSCLLDERRANGDRALAEHLFDNAQHRLTVVMGYLASTNPRTRFLVYSRGRIWQTADGEAGWVRDVEARLPALRGRLFTMRVQGRDGQPPTFRHAETVRELRNRVQDILALR
jgi:hypothetical protein